MSQLSTGHPSVASEIGEGEGWSGSASTVNTERDIYTSFFIRDSYTISADGVADPSSLDDEARGGHVVSSFLS